MTELWEHPLAAALLRWLVIEPEELLRYEVADTPRVTFRLRTNIATGAIKELLGEVFNELGWLFCEAEFPIGEVGMYFSRPNDELVGYVLVTNNSNATGIVSVSIRYDFKIPLSIRHERIELGHPLIENLPNTVAGCDLALA